MSGSRPMGLPALFLFWLISLFLIACTGAPAAMPAGATPAPGMPASGDSLRDEDGIPVQDGPVADADTGVRDGALIIYTGQLSLEVAELEPAVQSATELVVRLGGYVAGSEEENTTSHQSAAVTFRVPAARWTEAVRELRGLAQRVVSEHTESAEVTEQVVDLEARIANLRVSETALQEIMTRAGTIDDVLKVQRELSNVRGQIEQLTAQRDNLRDRAAYGTLSVYLQTPVVAAAAAQEGWQLGAEVDRALADLIRITQGLTSLAVWLAIVVLPVLVPVGLVAFVAYRLRRRLTGVTPPQDQVRPSM